MTGGIEGAGEGGIAAPGLVGECASSQAATGSRGQKSPGRRVRFIPRTGRNRAAGPAD
ncbi:hypothetical protein T261_07658 [Streptomyces lydicus]|nr:hypothetical protein T261_07658 [Streptomyces lydicus]